jgi:hypothetical protein
MSSMDEQPTASLVVRMPPAERLFLWAIRTWSASHVDLTVVWWSLDRCFSHEGMPAALPPFHEFMSTIFAGLKQWPDIRCVACPHLGRDEERLLHVLGHLQHGNEVGARAALNELTLRSAGRVACRHAAECVEIVSAAGLRFTGPTATASDVSACVDRPQGAPVADLGPVLLKVPAPVLSGSIRSRGSV